MADIFISYASEDREWAKQFAESLSDCGWSVWWDREIPFGKNFDKVIEENLAHAKCVVVLWSQHSVESRWVRAEASEGVGRDLLLPVVLARDLKLPLEFKRLQAADLADWHPDEPHEEFQRLLKSIKSLLGTPPNKSTEPLAVEGIEPAADGVDGGGNVGVPIARMKSKKALYLFGLLVLPSAIIVGTALALMNWRMPTRVQIELVVDRVVFSIAGPDSIPILDKAASFQSLGVESFESIVFKPKLLQIADPRDIESDTAEIRWNAVASDTAVVLRSRKQDLPLVTITSDGGTSGPVGRLEAISAEPGTQVTLETTASAGITLRLDGPRITPAVMPIGTFRLNAAHTLPAGDLAKAVLPAANLIALRAELAEDSPLIEVRGQEQSLVLTLTPAKNSVIEWLSKTGAPIRDIEFTRQSQNGEREPSLVAAGEIRYPDFPSMDKVVVDPHDFLGLDRLDRFFITELGLDPDGKNIRMRLAGIAGHIQTLDGANREDRRLTRFDTLWYGLKPAVLFSILVWVFSVTLGAYKLYKEFKQ